MEGVNTKSSSVGILISGSKISSPSAPPMSIPSIGVGEISSYSVPLTLESFIKP